MNSLAFMSDGYSQLRSDLLAHAPREAAAILLAGYSQFSKNTRLFIREALLVPREAYSVQASDRLEIHPSFLASVLKRARQDGFSLILAHSHPFDGPMDFSHADDLGEQRLMPTLFQRAPKRPHAALVLGPGGFSSRLRTRPAESEPISDLREVGRYLRKYTPRPKNALSPEFERNVRALGADGQHALRLATIGVVGLGGTGSVVAEQLAYLGVGKLLLLDPESIEPTNLNRVVGASRTDLGSGKVNVAKKHIERIRDDIEVVPIVGSINNLRDGVALLEADMIFCCTDSHGSRAVLNQVAYQYYLPVVDMGVRIDVAEGRVNTMIGRVQLLAPGLPCLQCQSLLDPKEVRRDLLSEEDRVRDQYMVGDAIPQPAVISINGTVASLGVTMGLSVLTGFASPSRHQLYFAHQGVLRSIESDANPQCIVCSPAAALGRGDAWPLPWRTA